MLTMMRLPRQSAPAKPSPTHSCWCQMTIYYAAKHIARGTKVPIQALEGDAADPAHYRSLYESSQWALGEVRVSSQCAWKRVDELESQLAQIFEPDDNGANVILWIREFEARHGRMPQIPELQSRFPTIPRTTAWRRIRSA